jgi:hypothetical protein
LELSASDKVDQSTAAKVGKLVGAKYLVVGSFFDLMGTLRIDARMLEVETGEIIGTAGQNGKMDDFFGLQALLSDDLAKVMLARAANPVSTPKITTPTKRAASRPKITTATVVEYSKALDAKDRGDTAGAKQALERVVKSAPDFSLAVLDLNALVQ